MKKYNRAEKDIEFSYDSFDGEGFISPSFAKEIDKQAFIVITDAREVYGLGFKN